MRPLIVPQPVTTPSPRGLDFAIPKSTQRWVTNMSYSSKLPSSSNSSIRSRAVSLPLACCASIRACPPPRRASSRRCSSCSRMSFHGPCPFRSVVLSGLLHARQKRRRARETGFWPPYGRVALRASPLWQICISICDLSEIIANSQIPLRHPTMRRVCAPRHMDKAPGRALSPMPCQSLLPCGSWTAAHRRTSSR